MRKSLQRMLNIYQMQLNDIAADTQSMLIEIRIIKRRMENAKKNSEDRV